VKVSVFVATSIDGFIARKDGALDWLDKASKGVQKSEDCGFNAFLSSVDAMIMGRKTFEFVRDSGQWPYRGKKLIILSSGTTSVPESLKDDVTISHEKPKPLLKRLSQDGIQHVYVDGGKTINGFLNEQLIDEIIITVMPVSIGQGIALFDHSNGDIELTLRSSKTYTGGIVQLHYTVAKAGDQTAQDRE
jgi:dihydrofolate reductase